MRCAYVLICFLCLGGIWELENVRRLVVTSL